MFLYTHEIVVLHTVTTFVEAVRFSNGARGLETETNKELKEYVKRLIAWRILKVECWNCWEDPYWNGREV
jgi:hypothetical protein